MRQYRELKTRYPDTVLLFRIGDFYETFEADAELISRELEIVLTSRSKIGDTKIPLAGVPYHAVDGYIAKLIGRGYRVAICDQVEDPKTAKGIVKREITRVITPGTVIDSSMVPSTAASYLMALCPDEKRGEWGIALLDISTGEFFVTVLPAASDPRRLPECRLRDRPVPACGVHRLFSGKRRTPAAHCGRRACLSPRSGTKRSRTSPQSRCLTGHFRVASPGGFGCGESEAATGAAGAALAYAKETQFSDLGHIGSLSLRTSSQSMMLDAITLRNLEVKESIRGGTKGATLFSSLEPDKDPDGEPAPEQPAQPPADRYWGDQQAAGCSRIPCGSHRAPPRPALAARRVRGYRADRCPDRVRECRAPGSHSRSPTRLRPCRS